MTQHKQTKKQIRERMKKTGESYTAARLHILDGSVARPANTQATLPQAETTASASGTVSVPLFFADGRPAVPHEVPHALPPEIQVRHPAGARLAQVAAGKREHVATLALMRDEGGAPVYVEVGAPITQATVEALVDNVRPSFLGYARTFGMDEPKLFTMVNPDGWFWIEFAWHRPVGPCRVASGWITPDHPAAIHRMAFVEEVVAEMNLRVFEVGSVPTHDGKKIEHVVIPPELWRAKPRLPRWGHLSFGSTPDNIYGSVGADTADQAIDHIVAYVKKCGDGQVRVRQAEVRVRPPAADREQSPERTETISVDPDWGLSAPDVAVIRGLLGAEQSAPRVRLVVAFEE